MTWVLIIGVAWLAVAAVTALVIARAIRIADQRTRRPDETTPHDRYGNPDVEAEASIPSPTHEAAVPRSRDAGDRAGGHPASGPRDRRRN